MKNVALIWIFLWSGSSHQSPWYQQNLSGLGLLGLPAASIKLEMIELDQEIAYSVVSHPTQRTFSAVLRSRSSAFLLSSPWTTEPSEKTQFVCCLEGTKTSRAGVHHGSPVERSCHWSWWDVLCRPATTTMLPSSSSSLSECLLKVSNVASRTHLGHT